MMESISGPGIVLRRSRHLEDDLKMVIFLRDFGKVAAVSKGGQRLKSRLKSVQEPFTEADFHVYAPPHGVNGRLASGRLINSHQNLRYDLDAFNVASQCCETVDALLPYRAISPDVYDILRESLQTLQLRSDPQSVPQQVWISFMVRLLNVLGHGDVSDKPRSFVEAELERILPWRLKSAGEVH